MEKLKRFVDLKVNTETCNLRCEYCYVAQNRKFNGKLFKLNFTEEEIKTAFSKEKLGGTCLINFCAGGETLLSDDIMKVINILLENGHYLMIVTNGTLKNRFKTFSKYNEDYKRRLFIKFSFHYLELIRLNLLEIFFDNVKLMKNSNISFTIELGAFDKYKDYFKEIQDQSVDAFGALPHITPLRDETKDDFTLLTELNPDDYNSIWNKYDSDLFKFRMRLWGEKRKEYCYAGDWSICINLDNGDITKCFCEKKIGNIFSDKKIKFEPVGTHCKAPYCYAGHAFLALGTCPDINYGKFDSLRDRENAKWLQPDMKNFMHQRLEDNNKKYSRIKKKIFEIKWNLSKPSIEQIEEDVLYNLSYSSTKFTTILEGRRNVDLYYNEIPKELKWLYNFPFNNINDDNNEILYIEALEKKCFNSKGTEIWLIGIIADDVFYSIKDLNHDKWLENKNMVGWHFYDLPDNIHNNIKINIPKSKKLKIVFESNKWRGKAKITLNNKDYIVNTYKNSTYGVKILKVD